MVKMLLRKGVKNANLKALRDPQFCHFKVAPLRRSIKGGKRCKNKNMKSIRKATLHLLLLLIFPSLVWAFNGKVVGISDGDMIIISKNNQTTKKGNEMAETPPSVGDTVTNSKSPTMAGQPFETVEFREIRKVDQTINGVVYSWHEYEFLTSANRCFIAVETVSPNKKFLSVREAKVLLQASGRIPSDIAGFVEIRSMVQTIDGIVHSWREYEFVASANRRFIAVETVSPNKKFLSVREAKALLRASDRIPGAIPKPDEMTVVPPKHFGNDPVIEEPFSLEPFLDQTTPKSLPKYSPMDGPDEDTEDRSKKEPATKKD